MPNGKIVPFGYSTPNGGTMLEKLMAEKNTYLVDIRYSVKSLNKPEWSGYSLKERYGERYLWIRALGNVNYFNHGPIRIADPEEGIARLVKGVSQGYTLILLCTCAHYEGCHRKTVVEMLQQILPGVQVIYPDEITGPDIIKAISIQQPFAWLITHPKILVNCGVPVKEIENREWTTGHRGRLLIHTGHNVDPDLFHQGKLERWPWEQKFGTPGATLWQAMPQQKDDYERGAIVGQASLTGVVTASSNPWFHGRYGLILQEACAFKVPIPYRGALKIFDVPASILTALA